MNAGARQLQPEDSGNEEKKTFKSEEERQNSSAADLIEEARELLHVPEGKFAPKEKISKAIEFLQMWSKEGVDAVLHQRISAKLDKGGRKIPRTQYEAFIDGLKLSGKLAEPDAAKLKEMMSEANYVNAVETAKEMEASRIPTYDQIVTKLMTFTPENLKDICTMMEKPKLQIVSDQSFKENIAAMDKNKHYTGAGGKLQKNAYVERSPHSPYNKLSIPGKVRVSIVDGIAHPKQLTGVSAGLGERRDHLTAKYTAKRMNHIDSNEMATLFQQSLREAETAKDDSLIVDHWEVADGTATFIKPDESVDSALVPYARFSSAVPRVYFNAGDSTDKIDRTRGRVSMQILEI